MNLNFYVEYHTEFGEELVLNLVSAGSAGKHETTEYRMSTLDGYHWSVQLKSVLKIGTSVDYYYSVMRGDGVVRREWTLETHRLQLVNANASNYHVYDHWTDIPENAYLYSSAMTECVNHHDMASVEPTDYLKTVRLKVRAPQLRSNERLAVVGSDASMGSWKVQNALPMVEHNINEWIVDVDVTRLTDGKLEFKFVVLDEDPDVSPLWESADNRVVVLPEMEEKEVVVYELPEAYFPIYDIKCAGTLVPVFSLRSRDSFGVGDFGDLKKMVDWVHHTRQRVLQVLPINDTTITHTWTDSYPYSCISIFALHPMYVNLNALPQLADEEKRNYYDLLQRELNALPQIDYERVNNAKIEYLRLLFEQEGKTMMADKAFKDFFDETKRWLVPYAKYCLPARSVRHCRLQSVARPSDLGRVGACLTLHFAQQSLQGRGILLLRAVHPQPADGRGASVCTLKGHHPQGRHTNRREPLRMRRMAGTALLQPQRSGWCSTR